ncbi:MAG TPA: EamA family transporter, partial [Chitinophagales bacterium]|nr:EamA family transporter [Chitinophagales bacterium]
MFAKLAFKYGVDGITILMIRMLFSLPFYIVILFFENNKKSIRIPQKTWTTILILGIIGYYLAALFDFIGLQYVSANLERIVIFTYPTFVLLMGKLFFN